MENNENTNAEIRRQSEAKDSRTCPREAMAAGAPRFPKPYKVIDGSLYMEMNSKQGAYDKKLCNFTPRLISEITVDDGAETVKRLRLGGTLAGGRALPEIEINGAELGTFNWLLDKWGVECVLEVGRNVKEYVRYFIQQTARNADGIVVFEHTGWKKIDGEWVYLLPSDEKYDVQLKGKLTAYQKENYVNISDLSAACLMTEMLPAPKEVIYPLIAFTFLTPLNHFLKQAGCMPKFVINIIGRTGTRKSTLAALFLSFFGSFNSGNLPLSFRDTANSIIHNAFALKDVLTCIDDFHPSGREDEKKLTATAQSIMRAYGDRTGRGRLRSDSTLMEARPPLGNAIITSEFPPNIGESGMARYLSLELKEGDVNLDSLTSLQHSAEKGAFRRTMYAYTQWLKSFLDDGKDKKFSQLLKATFEHYRDEFRSCSLNCHGRIPETVAWLNLGMKFFCMFLTDYNVLEKEKAETLEFELETILKDIASRQSDCIESERPTTVFIKKIYALIEAGKVSVMNLNSREQFVPPDFVGCEDNDYLYLNREAAHRVVRRLCDEQGEHFNITSRALVKALAEEGLIKVLPSGNTVSLRFAGKNRRYIALKKKLAEFILNGE